MEFSTKSIDEAEILSTGTVEISQGLDHWGIKGSGEKVRKFSGDQRSAMILLRDGETSVAQPGSYFV